MRTKAHGLSEKEKELKQLLIADYETSGDIQTKFHKLFIGTIEQLFESEMDEHLDYKKNSIIRNNYGKHPQWDT